MAIEKKLLVIGSGAREHAIAWKLAQSNQIHKVFISPGNPLFDADDKLESIFIKEDDFKSLVNFAKKNEITLTIVGAEQPLNKGITNYFNEHQLKIFAPNKEAAQLESSKAFSKDFLAKHQIPTADYQVFTDVQNAFNHLETIHYPTVIKANGLAAGKGVVICENKEQAKNAISEMMIDKKFSDAGNKIVIEEFLEGIEVSYICMVNGKNFIPLATSQDHKARDNGNKGPNTGGMGAYSPVPFVDQETENKIIQTIIKPTIKGLIKDNINYQGFLYAGLMLDKHHNPKVLEFNCRLGDPETQPLMMRMQSDLYQLIEDLLDNIDTDVHWHNKTALAVVLASKGYPEKPEYGNLINLPQLNSDDQNTKIFFAGASLNKQNNQITNTGGRILTLTVLEDDIQKASEKTYPLMEQINCQKSFYRTDIGYQALK